MVLDLVTALVFRVTKFYFWVWSRVALFCINSTLGWFWLWLRTIFYFVPVSVKRG